MDTENSPGASRQVPVVTLLVATGGIAAYLIPGLASQLVYDRAAILAGEGWRLFTGNWVHFSPSHLLYDLLALSIAGWIIECRGYPYFGLLCMLSAAGIGTVLLAMKPELQFYGGLSGVATAAIVYLALHGLKEPGPWRWICVAALVLTSGKILVESMTGQLTFSAGDRIPFVPVPLSHVVGGGVPDLLVVHRQKMEPCLNGLSPPTRPPAPPPRADITPPKPPPSPLIPPSSFQASASRGLPISMRRRRGAPKPTRANHSRLDTSLPLG